MSVSLQTSSASSPMSLRVDAQLRERLGVLAASSKRSTHALAIEAIENYVAERETQSERNEQAQLAWQHYQETGLHATGDEVMRWVASWGGDQELPMPQAHR